MNLKAFKKQMSMIVCSMLIAALALLTTGCNNQTTDATTVAKTEAVTTEASSAEEVTTEEVTTEAPATEEVTTAPAESESEAESASENADESAYVPAIGEDYEEVGEGALSFFFSAYNADGELTGFYRISTNETTVGAALLEQNFIAGEDSQYGLYVKTVFGDTYNFNTDGKYWAFYINGEYAMTGVDATDIEDGAFYEFRAE